MTAKRVWFTSSYWKYGQLKHRYWDDDNAGVAVNGEIQNTGRVPSALKIKKLLGG